MHGKNRNRKVYSREFRGGWKYSAPCSVSTILLTTWTCARNARALDKIRLNIIHPNCKETTTNSIKLRFGESSRTSLTDLSVLLRFEMSIFTLTNPVGSILGRRHKFPVLAPMIILPEALASVSFGFVLVRDRVRVRFYLACII